MKKQIIVLIVLFIACLEVNAQENVKESITESKSSFGFKGGYNLASVKFNTDREIG
ncbi:hypothetical protein [Lacinutrix algicola]|uniref:hypothetical protein n=1 Tax=Lacinutrix algicola TaxID=342954 RepID=UPI000A6CE700|nr:hypothetical protein [Lacinutrix algicola]